MKISYILHNLRDEVLVVRIIFSCCRLAFVNYTSLCLSVSEAQPPEDEDRSG